MRLGIHCLVAAGFDLALGRAAALGLPVMQMLPYRRHRDPGSEDFQGFDRARAKAGVTSLFIHSRFVPSLASSDPARRRRSIELLADELALCKRWRADAYVLHLGAYSQGGSAAGGLRLAADSIIEAGLMAAWDGGVLLENVAGGGRRLGGSLEELSAALDLLRARRPRDGVCIDTAHAWAAGYDVSTAEGALKLLARANRLLGLEAIQLLHLNDSAALLGSRLESHARWGRGRLGIEGLKTLLTRSDYADVPAVLEPPLDGDEAADVADLALLSRL